MDEPHEHSITGVIDTAISWAAKNPAASISVLSIALYTFLLISLRMYYAKYSLAPSEIGLDYVAILGTGTGVSLAFALGLVGATLLILRRPSATAASNIVQFNNRLKEVQTAVDNLAPDAAPEVRRKLQRRRDGLERHVDRLERDLTTLRRLTSLIVLAVVAAWSVLLLLQAATVPAGPRSPRIFDPLQVRVTPVRLIPVASSAPAVGATGERGRHPGLPRSTSDLLLLGSNPARYVLYDQETKQTVQVPAASFVVVYQK